MARFTHPNDADIAGPAGPRGEKGDTGPQGIPGGFGSYGSYYSTLTQSVLTNNQIAPVTYDSIDFQNGISIVNNSQITMEKPGKYNIAFSFEFLNSGGGSGESVNIWLRKNGQDVAWSNTKIVVNTNDKEVIAAWNFFVEANTGDSWQIMWSPDNHNIEMVRYLSNSHPAIPSAILTINQVG